MRDKKMKYCTQWYHTHRSTVFAVYYSRILTQRTHFYNSFTLSVFVQSCFLCFLILPAVLAVIEGKSTIQPVYRYNVNFFQTKCVFKDDKKNLKFDNKKNAFKLVLKFQQFGFGLWDQNLEFIGANFRFYWRYLCTLSCKVFNCKNDPKTEFYWTKNWRNVNLRAVILQILHKRKEKHLQCRMYFCFKNVGILKSLNKCEDKSTFLCCFSYTP